MKSSNLALALAAAFLLATAIASDVSPSDSLKPVSLGVQWDADRFAFSPACGFPNSGGFNCLRFPRGGLLRRIEWDSATKSGPGETLLILVLGPETAGARDAASIQLLATHHVTTGVRETMAFREVDLHEGLVVPVGYAIWVYGEGWVPAEVQVTLYFSGDVIAERVLPPGPPPTPPPVPTWAPPPGAHRSDLNGLSPCGPSEHVVAGADGTTWCVP